MKAIRQLIIGLIVGAGALYIWIAYVPAARPLLDRVGLLDLLGLEIPVEGVGAPEGGPRGGAAQVVTAPVGEKATVDRVNAIGDGRARRSVTVRSSAQGQITELNLAAGRRVEEGTIIVRLQDERERIALEQAQIELENTRTDAERIQRLENTGTVTEVRLRESQVALRSAELAVRQAEFELSQRQIGAPISGWVGIIEVEEGDRVNAQELLATITDRSDILIDFRVPERVIGQMQVGQQIEVTPLGLRDLTLTGEIDAIDTVVDRASRTLRVQGRVDNVGDLLRAGMAFSVALTFPGETLLSIAPLAVQWSSDGPFVWAVRDGKAVQVEVTIVQRNADSVLVTSGDLEAEDTVVTEGVQTLRPGAEVAPAGEGGTATREKTAQTKETL